MLIDTDVGASFTGLTVIVTVAAVASASLIIYRYITEIGDAIPISIRSKG